ncbi:MAG: cation transporter [Prolixibacteraceae bacterium]|nr:cation transporter [Prolixibacteraceae bacterium]
MKQKSLKKFIYLSILAAVSTIALKFIAWKMTGSVGLLSDAIESCVNLVAAVVALIMISISERPADEGHAFGHSKAEYFSSAIEGAMIIVASFSIISAAVPRIINPQPIENVGVGLMVSFGASLINLVVALILIKNGKKNKSITLEADGKHLMTDVWTSVGVLVSIGLVRLTGWLVLDGVVAVIVALNILWAGYSLIKRSAMGLMDSAVSEADLKKITDYLDSYKAQGIEYHSLLTRQSGQRIFVIVHILIPGNKTIQEGHDIAENIEKGIRKSFDSPITVVTHLEPLEDPCSLNDIGIDRVD